MTTLALTDEAGRLVALRSYGLLDTEPEPPFDELTALAAQLCGTPVSAISLIDEGREWFLAKVGVCVSQTPRKGSFGAHLLGWPGLFLVPDASLDSRFAAHPLVTGPSQLRFYAAAPLLTAEGQTLGALCVMDTVARELTARQQEALLALSRQVMAQLELRLATKRAQLGLEANERADEALRFQHARMSAERELSLDGILVVDDHGRVVSFNARFGKMWGVCDEVAATGADTELLQLVCQQLVAPEEFLAFWRKLADRHEAMSQDEVQLKDGRVFDRYSAPMREAGGRYYGRVWYFRDVTERNRAESLLREEGERAQRYLDTAEVILLALDLQGRITLINRKGCDLLGWTEAELLGQSWNSKCLPRVQPSNAQAFDRIIDGTPSSVVLNPVITRDGRERMIEWHNRALTDAHGQVTGSLSSGLDVTERRMLEQQYHQAQKMEAIGQLAAGVAHDFNNILTAILGYCELLVDLPGARGDVEEIQSAGLRAAALTRQLLDFSRKQIIAPTSIDLNKLLTRLRPMLERIVGESITVVLSLAPSAGAVKADRGQLEQVVMNLAVNARDAMPHGGTLTLTTSTLERNSALLTVSDTGTGMPPEVRARLFEPFFTTKEAGKGTGLGLATVHGIVLRSGGTVKVSTELGRGTSFEMNFPRSEAGEPVTEAAPRGPPPGGTETVLVVEDAEGLRALTKRLLERKGYRVVVAADSAEALRVFKQNASIEVVLTDVVMPGGSGPELTRQLLELRPGLKVVFMSGYTEGAISHHGVLDPGIALLHKPFSSETLGLKLREVLDRF